MCGINGLIDTSGANGDTLHSLVKTMTRTLSHRGPDDEGIWVDSESGVALGHRRLSILDLSAHGHQPMQSACGRYLTVYNGEIYNYRDIAGKLEKAGHTFRGHSDTEVLLAAIAEWGIERAVQQFNGMFAFALWDKKTRRLHLANDRMGEKPLYYGWSGKTFLFASELKSIRACKAFTASINRDALALYFRYKNIPAPHSIYRGIHKMLPGTILTLAADESGITKTPQPYWRLADVAEAGQKHPFCGSEKEAIDGLERVLAEAVEMRMIADVPLGAFLSGGIDSSLVAALMQSRSARPIQTFTIGFQESGYDEADYARAVAAHLGAQHTEMYVSATQAMEVIPALPTIYDEPFADCSQIPSYLLAKMTRQHVTVALSGDGGDELFAGYWRHFMATDIWEKIQLCPHLLRRISAQMMTCVSPAGWDQLRQGIDNLLPQRLRAFPIGDRVYKLAAILSASDEQSMYQSLVSDWQDSAELVVGTGQGTPDMSGRYDSTRISDIGARMMFQDSLSYLPGDILTKVDRATMATSLEARVPFLDAEVIAYAWRIPMHMKSRDGKGKWLLRQLLARYLPETLFNRPKMGFGVPIDSWLRGPLRDWGEELLDSKGLQEQGLLNPDMVRHKWEEHLSGRRNWQYHLWDVLMFQAWHAHWMNDS